MNDCPTETLREAKEREDEPVLLRVMRRMGRKEGKKEDIKRGRPPGEEG